MLVSEYVSECFCVCLYSCVYVCERERVSVYLCACICVCARTQQVNNTCAGRTLTYAEASGPGEEVGSVMGS